MKLDLLLIQMAILFIPGLIWARLDARYVLKSKSSDTDFALRTFLFGLISYAFTFVLYSMLGLRFDLLYPSQATNQQLVDTNFTDEIIFATLIGFVLSIIWIYASTHKWLSRFLQRIGATRRFGEEDVWEYTLNSSMPAVEYVHFRDFENQFVYCGWVGAFSESEKLREIVLRNVKAYDFEGVERFETPLLYLARKPESIHIEFPYRPDEKQG